MQDPSDQTPNCRREAEWLRGTDDLLADFDRAVTVFNELVRGYRALCDLGPTVTVFGSARLSEGSPRYAVTRAVACRLAESGFTVMTGGGPGLMEAANRGAKEGGGLSVGCSIELPHEQEPNRYLHRSLSFDCFQRRLGGAR